MGRSPFVAIALLAALQARAGDAPCVPGRAVSVLYGGQWYPAKVLKGPDRMGTCLVAYDGFGANWDEWVSAARMRAAPAGRQQQDAAAGQQQPGVGAVGTVASGRYSCYTFDAGQLNYTHTDVVIEGPGRYAVGARRGSFTVDAGGAMRFTGTLANASGRYAIKSGGKPQIELVFDGDKRASMACGKSR